MILVDTNLLLYAKVREFPQHDAARACLDGRLNDVGVLNRREIEARIVAPLLERLAEQPFDLVFMDLQMPVMNGLELVAAVKESKPSIPVILTETSSPTAQP